MSIIKTIKDFFANNALKKELLNNPREIKPNKFDFNKIKTVGILFGASDPEDFELVKRYVVYLREHGKKVKVIGYFSDKDIPALTYSKLEYDFFSRKELNWMGKPTTHIIDNFITEEFDLLIDLNIHDHFPLKYIASLSKSKFKVGKYKEDENENIYDMMIDSDNTQKLKYFLRQVDTYITMLNKPEVILN
jgi:hypothetical protein